MIEQLKIFKLGKIFFAIIFIMTLISCSKENKSELVLDLEEIFYDNNFTHIPDKLFNAADYGAIGDGKTLTTEAIQKTIDAASKAGGGKVIFEKGIYVSGSIFVKSNVELNIGEGVVIKAIQDDSQYPERMTRIAGFEMDWPSALINVYEEKNVRITGKGIID